VADDSILIYEELKSKKNGFKTADDFVDKWGERCIGADEIRKNQNGFILCFSLFDTTNILDIRPEGGTYIYSSSEAFKESEEVNFHVLYNRLRLFNFKVYGFKMIEHKPVFTKGFHASGHASREDLIWVINEIDPDIIIPIHTDNPKWFAKNFEKLLKNGQYLEL